VFFFEKKNQKTFVILDCPQGGDDVGAGEVFALIQQGFTALLG
jgi:hypothetical protein